MIDTGYGIYHEDAVRMFRHYGLGDLGNIRRIYITHADADHCGAGGLFDAKAYTHTGSLEIIRRANRAYGSRSESSILEEVYTTVINLFSHFTPPRTTPPRSSRRRGSACARSSPPSSHVLRFTTSSSRCSSHSAGTCTARSTSSAPPRTGSSSPPTR
ncbi:MBL fold metallo-hydrolase [Methanoculleus chikugoensis]|uniref:MBL fold metallo-hydrolase n=1 Tax=Methanoculleus chikugoensis TaxID=118126 RepID=UPI001FB1D2FF|nr:MBL fold metallo-hydrolase [Methanoculleus chikugoensis]